MSLSHRVTIHATADAVAAGAAPETAAVRLVSLLPTTWEVSGIRCTEDTATLSLLLPGDVTPQDATARIADALRHPALRGWTRSDRG